MADRDGPVGAKLMPAQIRQCPQPCADSSAPVPSEWLGDRLSVLWATFMGTRASVDADAVTLWLAEYIRLLSDLPYDNFAMAIGRSIMTAKHGFLPLIGEIRQHAEAPMAKRERMTDRLRQMAAQQDDPAAAVDLKRRLMEIQRNKEMHAAAVPAESNDYERKGRSETGEDPGYGASWTEE